MIYSLFL